MQTELAARIKEIDAQRVAAGLVLIISQDSKIVSRIPCRDEDQKAYKINQAELLGREWTIESEAN